MMLSRKYGINIELGGPLLICSGTEKQHVADDYAKRLHIGEVECHSVMATVLNDLAAKGTNAPKMDLSFCEYLNISVCPVTEGGDVRYC